ncbi:hypothetical protein JMN32_10100 [Fulvivirga sp. 29W222]|uniref:Uncharacterized protein n=1 Tax=Fulvivirga marina TaxID=2494733 RepID=A0A937FVD7_9BACT|nr:hypothetical protein [Fulvivirga marina]MBL6446664.1 hypothetical protein [Fulvivirga marina]
MDRKYSQEEINQLLSLQLENLNATHNLLSLMKLQNELLVQVISRLNQLDS